MTVRDSFNVNGHQVCSDYPARNLKGATEPLASEQFAKAHKAKPKPKKK